MHAEACIAVWDMAELYVVPQLTEMAIDKLVRECDTLLLGLFTTTVPL